VSQPSGTPVWGFVPNERTLNYPEFLMSRFTWLAVVGLAFTVCGCDLDKPLSDPNTSQVDERLLGRWVGIGTSANPEVEGSQLFVGRHATAGNPRGMMEALSIGYDPKNQTIYGLDSTRVTYVSTTKIGQIEMLNLYYEQLPVGSGDAIGARPADFSPENSYQAWSKSSARYVCLFRYVVAGDQLKLYMVDPSKLDDLADAGELTKSGDLISAESLAAYLASPGTAGIFLGEEDALTFRKAK
jgi:hypothetical protein